ncbi:hypothetical protein HMI54_001247 [Coelomomyces lativittatus]|nr:hypothetical protein HMI54_001247 [Coelomomyces lativittatus]
MMMAVHIPYCHKRNEFQLNLVPEVITRRIPFELFRARIEQLNTIVLQNTPHPSLRYIVYAIPFLMVGPILVFAHSGFGTVSSIVSVILLVSLFVPIVMCPLYINRAYWKCSEELSSAFLDFTRIDSLPPRCMEWHLAYPTAFEHHAAMFPKKLELTIELTFPATSVSTDDVITTTSVRATSEVDDLTPIALLPVASSPPPPPYSSLPLPKPGTQAPPFLINENEGLIPLVKPVEGGEVRDSGAVISSSPFITLERSPQSSLERPNGV